MNIRELSVGSFVRVNLGRYGLLTGIVGIHANHGIQVPADMLFSAALEGEKAPQHFIDRVIDNVIDAVQDHLRDRSGQRIDKDKIQYS